MRGVRKHVQHSGVFQPVAKPVNQFADIARQSRRITGDVDQLRRLQRHDLIQRFPFHAGSRRVYHPEWREYRESPVYDRYKLAPGATFVGPAIVEERESTTVVGPKMHAALDTAMNLLVNLE